MKGKGDFMTVKTKRGLAVGGGMVLCAALAILIATRFAPEPEAVSPSTSETSSTTPIIVEISTAKREEIKPIEIEKPAENKPDNTISNTLPTESDPEKEAAEFIEEGGIEIEQNFPEPEKPESAVQSEPPAPPQIENEEMLTNPDQEPVYEPEQTEVKQQETPSDTPKHGDRKDGMIYIDGFGWVVDEGGGGVCEPAPDMYENGNKIGYFG